MVDRSSLSFLDHEERRMSDLSDFWSVVSSVDNQINGDNQVDKHVIFGKASSVVCVKFYFQASIVRIYLIVSMSQFLAMHSFWPF